MTHSCYRDEPRCTAEAAYVCKLRSESVMETYLCVEHAAEVREDWPEDVEWIRNLAYDTVVSNGDGKCTS